MNAGDTGGKAHTFIHQHSHTHIDLSRRNDESAWLGMAWLGLEKGELVA